MKRRTMYAVVPLEGFIQDAMAIFDDETHAETFAESVSNDPDYDGCEYGVVPVWLDENALQDQADIEERTDR